MHTDQAKLEAFEELQKLIELEFTKPSAASGDAANQPSENEPGKDQAGQGAEAVDLERPDAATVCCCMYGTLLYVLQCVHVCVCVCVCVYIYI